MKVVPDSSFPRNGWYCIFCAILEKTHIFLVERTRFCVGWPGPEAIYGVTQIHHFGCHATVQARTKMQIWKAGCSKIPMVQ
jgi:hypothetical protein